MGFFFDIKCFFGTIFSVLKSDGVVEGGTGEMKKEAELAASEQAAAEAVAEAEAIVAEKQEAPVE